MHRRTAIWGGLTIGLATRSAAAGAPPVVLELFTSQGCSSCPPADALLGELSRQPNVMALAWHVDYWNNLGWKDPYASREWTDRQRAYARRLGAEVYTPALVVNGAAMVVGSDARAVRDAIGRAAPLSVNAALRRDGDAVVAEIGPATEPVTVVLALYDAERATGVRAGENSGRTLREYRIVRDVRPVSGSTRIDGVAAGQSAMLIVQDRSWRVVGAADLKAAVS